MHKRSSEDRARRGWGWTGTLEERGQEGEAAGPQWRLPVAVWELVSGFKSRACAGWLAWRVIWAATSSPSERTPLGHNPSLFAPDFS